MLIIAVLGITNMRTIQGELRDIVNDKFPKTVWANNMVDGINTIARAMRNGLLESDPGKIQKELDRIETQRGVIKENLAKLEDTIKSDAGKAILKEVTDARAKYVVGQDEFLKLIKEGKQAEAKVFLLSTLRATQATYIDAVNKIITFQSDLMKKPVKKPTNRSHLP
jgi:methyl-accepting chemotaxis protein